MRVLVACEYSGVVRDAFTKRGHAAFSCDLLPTESEGPHYQGDVRDILGVGWDLLIAHPPCTYISRAGARWMYPTAGVISSKRFAQAQKAKEFFLALLHADIPRIAVENPTPLKLVELPSHTQVVQPYEYGHPYSKRTLLWLRGLPPLTPTNILEEYVPYLPSNTGGKRRGQKATLKGVRGSKQASKFWPGIAEAMADQWGNM